MLRRIAILMMLLAGTVLAEGQGKPTLVAGSIDNGSLALDGRAVLVQGKDGTLSLLDLDTRSKRKVLSGIVMDARLDPSGTRILMLASATWKGADYYGLWVVNVDGSGLRPFLAKPELAAEERCPIWSPDGSSMAWARDGRVWTAAADGSGARALTLAIPDSFAFPLDWMGDELLFGRSDSPTSGYLIYRLNMRTNQLVNTGLTSMLAMYFGTTHRLIFGSGPMRIWNADDRREEGSVIELGVDLANIQALSRSSDCSRYLISAGDPEDTAIQHLYLLEVTAPALPASAVSASAQAEAPEIADLARALLAPLPSPLAERSGSIALPKGYPANRALALERLNRYRLATGLRPYAFDPALSEMGQAHADYILANAGTGAEGGHFELPGYKGYTKGGDEAARTSGIAYGESDPLAALEGLMGGTYHRLQFLRSEETRVGLGHSYGPSSGRSYASGGTLVVTRKEEGAAPPKGPRFVLFPPDGFDDTPTTFASGENPDPRPVMGPNSPDSGFPITISLLRDDVEKFEGAAVVFKDDSGAEIPFWLSYPGRPAVANPDLGIYADDKASIAKAYRDNFDAVFILPKAPLAKGRTYSVRAELRIGGKAEILSWFFKTRGPTLWTVRPGSSDPRESLESALDSATEGDTILLAAGEYSTDEPIIIEKAIRIIGKPGRTVLRYKGTRDMAAMAIDSRVVLRGLDFAGKFSFYIRAGSGLLLKECRFAHDDARSVVAAVARGASLVVEGCDFKAYASPYLAYFEETPATSAQPILYLGTGNAFGALDYYGKRSFGLGLERTLKRSLE